MPRPEIAVAGIPGAWSSEALASALREQGASTFILTPGELSHDLSTGRVCSSSRGDLYGLDGLVVKKLGELDSQTAENRLVMLKRLQEQGIPVISKPEAIESAVNRYRMSWLMCRAGIPMPETLVTESLDQALAAVDRWGKAIAKPLYTTKGRGMILLEPGNDIESELRELHTNGHQPFYLQQFIESPGRDVAVVVLAGRVLGSFSRVAAPGQWMTTTAAGGHYEACELDGRVEELALAAAETFGLDFTSVDMVHSRKGWLVYEVSAFGGFRGLYEAYGVDAASRYAAHVIRKIRDERV